MRTVSQRTITIRAKQTAVAGKQEKGREGSPPNQWSVRLVFITGNMLYETISLSVAAGRRGSGVGSAQRIAVDSPRAVTTKATMTQ